MQNSSNRFPLFQSCLSLVFLWFSVLVGCSTVPTHFSPVDPLPIAQFRHDAFDSVLREHVRDGKVDYPAIGRDARSNTYLRQLDRIDPTGYRNDYETLAFWINAHNALAIQGILAGNSLSTITGKCRYFIGCRFRIGGGDINLWSLED